MQVCPKCHSSTFSHTYPGNVHLMREHKPKAIVSEVRIDGKLVLTIVNHLNEDTTGCLYDVLIGDGHVLVPAKPEAKAPLDTRMSAMLYAEDYQRDTLAENATAHIQAISGSTKPEEAAARAYDDIQAALTYAAALGTGPWRVISDLAARAFMLGLKDRPYALRLVATVALHSVAVWESDR